MSSDLQTSPMSAAIGRDRRGGWRALGIAALFFVSLLVTLPMLEFSSGGENLLMSTATETRRTGNWLIPTLNGNPRVNKPPLPMWISALAITDSTMAGLDSGDAAVRDAAFQRLSWQARWPALLSAALAVLVAYELGMTLSGRYAPIGWISASACAGMLLFVRNTRLATTDVQLMLWVSVANWCIAKSLFDGWRWRGAIGAGLAIGLAMMSKGPVALVQSIAPLLVFIIWRAWRRRGEETKLGLTTPVNQGHAEAEQSAAPDSSGKVAGHPRRRFALPRREKGDETEPGIEKHGWVAPAIIGALAALVVGVPWYVLMYVKNPAVLQGWAVEVTREGATELPPGDWYGYVDFPILLAPWTVFFIVGVVGVIRDTRGTAALRGDVNSPERRVVAGGFAVSSAGHAAKPQAASGHQELSIDSLKTPPRGFPAITKDPKSCFTTGIPDHAATEVADADTKSATSVAAFRRPPVQATVDQSSDRWVGGMVMALLLVVVPIVVMSFFRDRKDRYLLPMAIPAAVVVARGVIEYAAARDGGGKVGFIALIHWVVVGVFAVGLPIAGATRLKTLEDGPWFSLALAAPAAVVMAGVLGVGIYQDSTRRRGMVIFTTVLMLAAQVLLMHGYAQSREGRSEMKPMADAIWRDYPHAQVLITGAKKTAVPPDLPLYLNRAVEWVDSPEQLERLSFPRIVVTRQRHNEPWPAPPPGWRALEPVMRDRNRWHAFLLPAK